MPSASGRSSTHTSELLTLLTELRAERTIRANALALVHASDLRIAAMVKAINDRLKEPGTPLISTSDDTDASDYATDQEGTHTPNPASPIKTCAPEDVYPLMDFNASYIDAPSKDSTIDELPITFHDTLLDFEATCTRALTYSSDALEHGHTDVDHDHAKEDNHDHLANNRANGMATVEPVRSGPSKLTFILAQSPERLEHNHKATGCFKCHSQTKPTTSFVAHPHNRAARRYQICRPCKKHLSQAVAADNASTSSSEAEQSIPIESGEGDARLIRTLNLRSTNQAVFKITIGESTPAKEHTTAEFRGYLRQYILGTFAPDTELMATFGTFLNTTDIMNDQSGPASADLLVQLYKGLAIRHTRMLQHASNKISAQLIWETRTIAGLNEQ
ncbi:uncharacterized protein L969DRAFT_385149 [Mixia osmundae IAM 14324]|uniref:uncharacterized protein n=1 Tax=Mixia osmundae (strain CBS 9802 / IAM 14324 / JCM 22182 / KY 12970) TaxID=764103 RepID=UPI0004A55902|nr:uncharacterized protein L969DRAFT_385149 [Mixia osmundae IAM 14324]KEI39872.1 hypothetical protein L969DRAFT_385149 [Mixia osmundae IAM 14324]